MDTVKLYDSDSYLTEFEGRVLSFSCVKDKIEILLDKTAFFPEGGGQSSDKGFLGEVYISDVQIKKGKIFHCCENTAENFSYLSSHPKLKGKIDFKDRFDKMQQHSGEHIFSGIAHSLFGLSNVGFHLGEEEVTLDFDGILKEEDIKKIEYLSNRVIWDNKPILIKFPTDEELKSLSYRSKIEIEGQTRIVEIPSVDLCACCAPHVKATGEIGILKVISFKKQRGGTRITILCGERAFRDIDRKLEENHKVSVLTSSKQEETSLFVEKLKKEKEALAFENVGLKRQLLSLKADKAPARDRIIIFSSELSGELLFEFSLMLKKKASLFAACFDSEEKEGSFKFSIASDKIDPNDILKKLKEKFTLSGGGRGEMVRGTIRGKKEEIKTFLEKVDIS